jgi:hypothetical protein
MATMMGFILIENGSIVFWWMMEEKTVTHFAENPVTIRRDVERKPLYTLHYGTR